jgi:hypothetical protein
LERLPGSHPRSRTRSTGSADSGNVLDEVKSRPYLSLQLPDAARWRPDFATDLASVVEAVSAAVEIQQALEGRNMELARAAHAVSHRGEPG